MNPDRIAHRVLDLIRHPRQPHEIAAAITTNRHPVTPQVVLAALINLERDGKTLSEAQRTAWRVSIDRRPAAEPMGTFTPIPNDALPPGMRKHNP